jgi:hypothetical protein
VSFFVTNRMGQDVKAPDAETIDRVLAELDEPVDDKHPDISLTHETGWSLGAFPSGAVIWENVENHDASEASTHPARCSAIGPSTRTGR